MSVTLWTWWIQNIRHYTSTENFWELPEATFLYQWRKVLYSFLVVTRIAMVDHLQKMTYFLVGVPLVTRIIYHKTEMDLMWGYWGLSSSLLLIEVEMQI